MVPASAARLGLIPSAAIRKTLMPSEDARLVQDCLNGKQRAWDELVERYGRLVYSIPLRIGLSATDADDVTQVVWTIVLQRLESLREVDRFSAWLIRTTYHEAWRRGRQTRKHAALDETAANPTAPADDELERVEKQHLVRRALEELDDRCRELLTLLFLGAEKKSYAEIASELGMKAGSIGPTRARCFKRMEQILRGLES